MFIVQMTCFRISTSFLIGRGSCGAPLLVFSTLGEGSVISESGGMGHGLGLFSRVTKVNAGNINQKAATWGHALYRVTRGTASNYVGGRCISCL